MLFDLQHGRRDVTRKLAIVSPGATGVWFWCRQDSHGKTDY